LIRITDGYYGSAQEPRLPEVPDVKTLEGKEIVVSGKFVDLSRQGQIELTDPKQIKIVK